MIAERGGESDTSPTRGAAVLFPEIESAWYTVPYTWPSAFIDTLGMFTIRRCRGRDRCS